MDQVDASPDPQTVKISLPWTWRPVKRRMLPGCELFREGDTAMHMARKLIPLENDDDDDAKASDDCVVKETIPCSVIGCTQTFTSLLSYENHYKSTHRHTCLTCHRTFPSDFLLDLHIQENHDPLFAVLASRQDMFRCLVESCSDKFRGADDRRQHMVSVHSYPANFRFHSLRPPSQPRHSRKKAAQSDTAAGHMDMDKPPSSHHQKDDPRGDMDVDKPPSSHHQKDDPRGDIDVDKPPSSHHQKDDPKEDTSDTSTLATPHSPACPFQSPSDKENCGAGADANCGLGERGGEGGMEVGEAEKQVPRRVFVHKVPQNFSFGHGVSRGFQRPPGKKKGKKKGAHWHQRMGDDGSGETTSNIENVDMKDMADALSDAV